MQKKGMITEENAAAPAIRPDQLAKLKKEDMKLAIVERFRCKPAMPASRTAARHGARSPYWRPADEEC